MHTVMGRREAATSWGGCVMDAGAETGVPGRERAALETGRAALGKRTGTRMPGREAGVTAGLGGCGLGTGGDAGGSATL